MPPDYKWLVEYLDGRWVSNQDRHWDEISVVRNHGREVLRVLREPAASLSAVVAGRVYTVRAPNRETFFFRYYRARTPLSGAAPSEVLFHAIGYLGAHGKEWLEIDPRGNCQHRFEPSIS